MSFKDSVAAQFESLGAVLHGYIAGLFHQRFPQSRARARLIRQSQIANSFNGKLARKMLKDRREILSVMADKFLVRNHISNLIGNDYLAKLYQVADSPEDIRWDLLPNKFVVKLSHGSGGVIVVGNFPGVKPLPYFLIGNVWPKFLVDHSFLNIGRLNRILRHLMQQNYEYLPNKYPEWAYKHVQPKILIEEYLSSPGSDVPPNDYKLFCFNGHCKIIQVDSNRFKKHTRDMFDLDWNFLPLVFTYPNSKTLPNKPATLKRMISIAEKLSENNDFLRVDLFTTENKVFVGELTNYPEGGLGKFIPKYWDQEFAKFWD
jgi:hypothetical protein